jgi:hypothetical protein
MLQDISYVRSDQTPNIQQDALPEVQMKNGTEIKIAALEFLRRNADNSPDMITEELCSTVCSSQALSK